MHFYRLLAKHRSWLEQDVGGWGKVGYVLACIGRPKPVIAWLQDWRRRTDAQSWMLYNLVIALQQTGQYDECREVIRHAVALRHGGDLYEFFRVAAAFEEALLGNSTGAQEHLSTLPLEGARQDLRPVWVMTQLLIAMRGDPGADRKQFARRVKTDLRQAFRGAHPVHSGRYVRGGYRRFMKAASAHAGRWLRVWGWSYDHLGI